MSLAKNAPFLLARCKSYHSLEETATTIENLVKMESATKLKLCVAVPFSYIHPLSIEFNNPTVAIGAEMILNADEDSFPGTIAGQMIKEAGAQFVLIGSSDERQAYVLKGETVKHKITKALESDVTPIVCLGETLIERQDGTSKNAILKQISETLSILPPDQLNGLNILYETSWLPYIPWNTSSEELLKIYESFHDALVEAFDPTVVANFNLLYTAPSHHDDFAQLIQSLSAHGFYLGLLTPDLKSVAPQFPDFELPATFLAPKSTQETPTTPLAATEPTPVQDHTIQKDLHAETDEKSKEDFAKPLIPESKDTKNKVSEEALSPPTELKNLETTVEIIESKIDAIEPIKEEPKEISAESSPEDGALPDEKSKAPGNDLLITEEIPEELKVENKEPSPEEISTPQETTALPIEEEEIPPPPKKPKTSKKSVSVITDHIDEELFNIDEDKETK